MTDETAHDWASGDDTITGGAGADTFVFDSNHGNDVVTDFTDGEDLIDLSAFSTISGFSDLTVTSGENGVTIDLTAHGGGTIRLENFDVADLDAEDFVFAEPTVDPGAGVDGMWPSLAAWGHVETREFAPARMMWGVIATRRRTERVPAGYPCTDRCLAGGAPGLECRRAGTEACSQVPVSGACPRVPVSGND